MKNDYLDYPKQLDGVERQERINELEMLSAQYLNDYLSATIRVIHLEIEMRKMKDRQESYQSIKDGYWKLCEQVEDELNKLVPGRKGVIFEKVKKELEVQQKHQGEDDLPF